jgi:hypothetical protein
MGGIRGHRSLVFGFSSYRTRRVYGGFCGLFNCTAQAEQQAQPPGLWEQTLPFRNLVLWWEWGSRGLVGYACCFGAVVLFRFFYTVPVVSFCLSFSRDRQLAVKVDVCSVDGRMAMCRSQISESLFAS